MVTWCQFTISRIFSEFSDKYRQPDIMAVVWVELGTLVASVSASITCGNQTQLCTEKMKSVEGVFRKGDFSSLVDEDTMTLNCSDHYLKEIKTCVEGIESKCNGHVAVHPKLYFAAYNFVCKKEEDFLDADYCYHSDGFVKVLIECAKRFGSNDTVCHKFPTCLQRKIALTHECSGKDGRTTADLVRETLKLKYSHC